MSFKFYNRVFEHLHVCNFVTDTMRRVHGKPVDQASLRYFDDRDLNNDYLPCLKQDPPQLCTVIEYHDHRETKMSFNYH